MTETSPAPKLRLTKAMRLLKSAEFDRVFREGKKAADGRCKLHVLALPGETPRLGCVISRKVGCAVKRNRVRRLYREAFRHLAPTLGPVSLVAIPTGPTEPSLAELLESWPKLIAKALRASAPSRPAPPKPSRGPAP